MSPLRKLQRVAFWMAVICAALGFLTSAGCQFAPWLPTDTVALFHVVLLALGGVAGYCACRRGVEIDRERWRIVEEPGMTSGERDYAHKHAERERRSASTAFIAAPLMLGYWLAYQIEGEGRALAAQLLPAAALVGAVIGWFVGRRGATTS